MAEFNDPLINPANAADRVTLEPGVEIEDFNFYPPGYELLMMLRNQPQPDADLKDPAEPEAFTGTTDVRNTAARRNASARKPLGGRMLHR